MIRIKLFFFIFFLMVGNVKAQNDIHKLDSILNAKLNRHLRANLNKLRDSNNVYSFAIKINLSKVNNTYWRIDSVSTNEPQFYKILFGNLMELKEINFKKYLGNKKGKIKIIKPISILIGLKIQPHLSTADIYKQNCKLFYLGNTTKIENDFYYNNIMLSPFINSLDLKVYD